MKEDSDIPSSWRRVHLRERTAEDRPYNQIWQSICQQTDFIRSSSKLFDDGRAHEGKRIAVALFNLMITRGKTQVAIFDQIGEIENFLVRCSPVMQSLGHVSSIVELSLDYSPHFKARQDLSEFPQVSLCEWLDSIAFSSPWLSMTRRELILRVRDQEGGAHFDGRRSRARDIEKSFIETGLTGTRYAHFKETDGFFIETTNFSASENEGHRYLRSVVCGDRITSVENIPENLCEFRPIRNLVAASMRQMAEEYLTSWDSGTAISIRFPGENEDWFMPTEWYDAWLSPWI